MCLSGFKIASGQMLSFPKKSELKIGESSAFFTYVKSVASKSINQGSSSVHETAPQHTNPAETPILIDEVGPSIQGENVNETLAKNHVIADDHPSTNSLSESFSMERSSTPPMSLDVSQQRNSKELPREHMHLRNSPHNDVTGFYNQSAYPYYMSGVMHQVPSSSASLYPKNIPEMHNHANSSLVPHYNHIQHCPPHIPGIASYPYYPFGICLQPGQIPASHPWPSFGNPSSNEGGQLSKVDRREAALMKFRQKRKERCFDKKIRYVNRKKLAERRPRVRGQFVRKVNGVKVDLNGQPASTDEEEEEEYEEEVQTANMDFSPEDDASMCL